MIGAVSTVPDPTPRTVKLGDDVFRPGVIAGDDITLLPGWWKCVKEFENGKVAIQRVDGPHEFHIGRVYDRGLLPRGAYRANV